VIHDLASGIEATSSGARIRAMLVDTRSVLGALGADDALGPAHRGSPDVADLARAYRPVANATANAVGATR